jgi:hypothetical protein
MIGRSEIATDQGFTRVEDVDHRYTIRGQPIVSILTSFHSKGEPLLELKKDSIDINIPYRDTYISIHSLVKLSVAFCTGSEQTNGPTDTDDHNDRQHNYKSSKWVAGHSVANMLSLFRRMTILEFLQDINHMKNSNINVITLDNDIILYHILLPKWSYVSLNGLIVESLHPTDPLAERFLHFSSQSLK